MKETRSSLFPTAMVLPLGDQAMFMFSPFVGMLATHLWDLLDEWRMKVDRMRNYVVGLCGEVRSLY